MIRNNGNTDSNSETAESWVHRTALEAVERAEAEGYVLIVRYVPEYTEDVTCARCRQEFFQGAGLEMFLGEGDRYPICNDCADQIDPELTGDLLIANELITFAGGPVVDNNGDELDPQPSVDQVGYILATFIRDSRFYRRLGQALDEHELAVLLTRPPGQVVTRPDMTTRAAIKKLRYAI